MLKVNRSVFLSAVFVVGGIGLVAVAGDLNPPAGPVDPTMKDLDDVEPRGVIRNNEDGVTPIVISQPGSYKLGENIFAIGGEHGIEITTGQVTIDLNGFEIRGGEIASINGIFAEDGVDALTIRNGRIRLFGGAGISFVDSERCRIEDVDVVSTNAGGIICGDSAFIENCTASNVTIAFAVGISAGERSKVLDCSVDDCSTGVLVQTDSHVTNCSASGSTFASYYVIGGANLKDNFAIGVGDQTQHGIYQEGVGGGAYRGNVIRTFSIAGIRTGSGFEISGNVLSGGGAGDTGIDVHGACYIFENTIFNCTNGLNMNFACLASEVFANRTRNTPNFAINSCATIAPVEQAHLSTNPHANLN